MVEVLGGNLTMS